MARAWTTGTKAELPAGFDGSAGSVFNDWPEMRARANEFVPELAVVDEQGTVPASADPEGKYALVLDFVPKAGSLTVVRDSDSQAMSIVTSPTAAIGATSVRVDWETGKCEFTAGNASELMLFSYTGRGTGLPPALAGRLFKELENAQSQLSVFSGLAKTDSNFIVGNGSTWVVESGATARASLGLGSIATQNSNSVTITGGSISGITDLAVADGGTGASTASAARTNLGLAIGTNVQAFDADLSAIAGLATTDGNFVVGNGSTWVAESGATARTSLGLGSISTQNANSVAITGGAIDGTTIGGTTPAAGSFTTVSASSTGTFGNASSGDDITPVQVAEVKAGFLPGILLNDVNGGNTCLIFLDGDSQELRIKVSGAVENWLMFDDHGAFVVTDVTGTNNVTANAAFVAPLGSASSCSLQAIGDANTGIYFPVADQCAVVTGGTARLTVTNSLFTVNTIMATNSQINANQTNTASNSHHLLLRNFWDNAATEESIGWSLINSASVNTICAYDKVAWVSRTSGSETAKRTIRTLSGGSFVDALVINPSGDADFVSNVDVASGKVYKVNGTQVVGAQGAMILDVPTEESANAEDNATAINAILARMRATGGHGLIEDSS